MSEPAIEEQQDDDATEEEIAAALIVTMQGGAPSVPDVEAAIGPILLAYLLRATVGLVLEQNVSAPEWIDQAEGRAAAAARDTVENVTDQARDSIAAIADDVADLPPQERTREISERIAVGGRRLATFAVTSAREAARVELAKDLGVTHKVWRTRKDGRVRPAHIELEGEQVLLDGEFHLQDGRQIRNPGDPDADIDLTAGCRCRLSFRLVRQA